MQAFLVLAALALALTVVLRIVEAALPIHMPAPLTLVLPVAVAIGLAWMLDYSAFAAFGQELRAEWMHPVFTGIALVAVGEFLRSLVSAIGRRTGDPAGDSVSARTARAA